MANRVLVSASLAAAALLLQGCTSGYDTTNTTMPISTTTSSPSGTTSTNTTTSGPATTTKTKTTTTTTTSTTTTSTTTTTTSSVDPSGYKWKSNPIEVRGSHLFDSVTGQPFLGAGIAFPNLGEAPVSEWIDVLKRIKNYSSNVNLIRIYEYPTCIWDTRQGYCFEPFMQAADDLGVYVLVAGTGTVSGYLPLDGWKNASDAYQMGKVLDFGRGAIQRFYYPNTLAVVIGNEFLRESTWTIATVLKAYARDLKKYMAMCRDDEASPSHKSMRQMPLIYASNDDYGDELEKQKTAYLFCGNASTSIDMFGLNVERWCDPNHKVAYDSIHAWVSAGNLPGAFMFTEMGCSKDSGYHATGARDWAQVPSFFSKFPAFDGFSAYAYWNAGATNFNMFDSKGANATIYEDGINFFKAMENPGQRDQPSHAQAHPDCPAQIGVSGKMATLELLDNVPGYNEESFPAEECPQPRATIATEIAQMPVAAIVV